MEPNKTLIVYQTKSLVTEENADQIADILREQFQMEVDVVNLKENSKVNIEGYKNIIVGSGIRMGMWYGRVKKFLKNKFKGKNIAIFISSGTAGKDKQQAINLYIDKLLEKRPYLKPFSVEAFGGWYKKGGKITQNYRDPEKVKQWARFLGEKLSSF